MSALFQFMMEAGPISIREMYATFNQGVDFAAYVARENADGVLAAPNAAGYDAWLAGRVRKAVVISSLGLGYGSDTPQVR